MSSIRSRSLIGITLLGGLMFMQFGCGGGPAPPPERMKTVPVQGTVYLRNKKLPGADVVFHHVDGKVAARGKTGVNGEFTLTTYEDNDGAPAGKYRVTVSKGMVEVKEIEEGVLAPTAAEGEEIGRIVIPQKYMDETLTDIEVEITEAGPNQIEVKLK